MDRVRRFIQYRPGFQLLVAEAFVRLLIITLVVRLLPSRWTCRMCASPPPTPNKQRQLCLAEVCHAVTTAANYIPGANCLPQALVARVLLTRSGHTAELKIGVAKPDERFTAHAWVSSEGKVVVGRSNAAFVELPAS
jgi:hypothetical protein